MRVLCLLAFLFFAFSAHAQTDVIVNWRAPGGTTPVTNSNPLPVSASVSASITGFRPTAYGTPISATTGGATGTLPAGAEVVATNVGTFGAFCKLGASVDTTGQYLSPGGAWFAFAISGDTQLTCQGVGGTTTINMAGGSGLPTGTGGGGGSSGGGTSETDEAAFTYGTTAYTPMGGVYNSSITNLTSGQGGAVALTAARSMHVLDDNSAAILAGITGAIPAGTNIIGKVGIDQTTPGTTNGVQLPTTTNGGAATVKGGVAVVNGGSFYQAVAASQTATVLQSSTGAVGDYLSHCVIYPTSTSPGVVTVFDNANAAATNVIAFPGGASSVSNLVPIAIPVGAVSTAGAWKVTTGANVSVVCFGKFS